jgi:hypothetical protein
MGRCPWVLVWVLLLIPMSTNAEIMIEENFDDENLPIPRVVRRRPVEHRALHHPATEPERQRLARSALWRRVCSGPTSTGEPDRNN